MATYEPQRYTPAPGSPYQHGYPGQQNFANDNNGRSSAFQQSGPMTMYHPSNQSLAVPQQSYQQNTAAFEPVHNVESSRRTYTPDPERLPASDPRRDNSEPPPRQREKIQTTGGPLAGAASGALIGASVGQRKGHEAVGTIGGMLAGAVVGNRLERTFKERRQERLDLQEQVAENNRSDPREEAQSRYDDEYTKVAFAAPGYGSSLLPADTSHGGRVRRNSRTSS